MAAIAQRDEELRAGYNLCWRDLVKGDGRRKVVTRQGGGGAADSKVPLETITTERL